MLETVWTAAWPTSTPPPRSPRCPSRARAPPPRRRRAAWRIPRRRSDEAQEREEEMWTSSAEGGGSHQGTGRVEATGSARYSRSRTNGRLDVRGSHPAREPVSRRGRRNVCLCKLYLICLSLLFSKWAPPPNLRLFKRFSEDPTHCCAPSPAPLQRAHNPAPSPGVHRPSQSLSGREQRTEHLYLCADPPAFAGVHKKQFEMEVVPRIGL